MASSRFWKILHPQCLRWGNLFLPTYEEPDCSAELLSLILTFQSSIKQTNAFKNCPPVTRTFFPLTHFLQFPHFPTHSPKHQGAPLIFLNTPNHPPHITQQPPKWLQQSESTWVPPTLVSVSSVTTASRSSPMVSSTSSPDLHLSKYLLANYSIRPG